MNVLTTNLAGLTALNEAERQMLKVASTRRTRMIEARCDLIAEGDVPRAVNTLLAGWACRYKQLPTGRRQILGFLLPGDICDANVYILEQMDHSIGAITEITVGEIKETDFAKMLSAGHPNLSRAMWHQELVTASIQREWVLSLGQRSATERVAHLLVELFMRLRYIGLTDSDSCEFPLTQQDIADAMGLTAIHVNRTLQELRSLDLIVLKNRRLEICDMGQLKQLAMFDPAYLHHKRARGSAQHPALCEYN